MSLKVIGAGLGRTGTFSLKNALEALGYVKTYHMVELFQHPEGFQYWQAAAEGQPVEWDALFQGYAAAVDYPVCLYYRELMTAYPSAKFVLTVRDPEQWYESVLSTIYSVGRNPRPGAPPPEAMLRIFRHNEEQIWGRQFGGRFEDREHAIAMYHKHNEDVKQTVPADRLLVYDVRQGWEPLCRFLGVPVPQDRVFPRLNSREDFGKFAGEIAARVQGSAAPSAGAA